MNYPYIYVLNNFPLQLSTGYAFAAPIINYQIKIMKVYSTVRNYYSDDPYIIS